MARDVEEVGDRIMDGDGALQMPLWLEALHHPLSPSDWLMGILRPIVQAFVAAVLDTMHTTCFAGAIGSEPVGDHHTRRQAVAFQKLAY